MHNLEAYYRDVLKLDESTVKSFISQHQGIVQMDVITIRNRNIGSSPSLSELIIELQAAGYQYDVIHCSFCRGFSNGTNKGQQEPILVKDCVFT